MNSLSLPPGGIVECFSQVNQTRFRSGFPAQAHRFYFIREYPEEIELFWESIMVAARPGTT